MSAETKGRSGPTIERLDPESLEARLRKAAGAVLPEQLIDELELNHLSRVVTECSLLLTDVYSEQRIARIMHPESGYLQNLLDRMIEQERRGEGEVLYRIRRLPEDVRVVGDKALFDCGLLGLREVKGFDLEDLGRRAYRVAGEVLQLLADDRRLRRFFAENRLLMLPLEEEVVFLRQCSERFRFYADVLRRTRELPLDESQRDTLLRAAEQVPLMEAVYEVLTDDDAAGGVDLREEPAAEVSGDAYLLAAQGEASADATVTRDQQLSVYERILLFSAIDMDRLKAALNSTVIDQARAVDALCDEFSLFAAGTRDPRKPPAYFMVGPTGVGKNHLVETLCRLMEGIWEIEIPVLTIEGPNYTYPSDINELRGATRGFIRSDEEGLLTSFHERSSRAPFSVILIDEVEKAHSQLLTFFLPILDRGTTTDNRGKVLNFSNCMLFFTSNLGYSDAQQAAAPIGYAGEAARIETADVDVRRELRRALKPEFVNRVRMIHFDRLTAASAERILDLELERIARRYEQLHRLRLLLDESARGALIQRGFSPAYGARHLASTLENVCNVEIAKKVRRDDRGSADRRGPLVRWLREIRAGKRAFDAEEVQRKVQNEARARLGYDTLRIIFRNGRFEYEAESRDDGDLPS